MTDAVIEDLARPLTAADRIADVLREAIVAGRLAPGAVLRQDELAARFRLSRMPVRDALRRLESEGLVAIHPTRGATVAPLDPVEIRETYALRILLEAEALRLSGPRLAPADVDAAEAALDRLDREPDVALWGPLNRDFHLRLYGACGNARLIAAIEAQHLSGDRHARVLLAGLAHHDRSQAEHRAILDAVRDGRIEAAVTVLVAHLAEGGDILARAAAERLGEAPPPPTAPRTPRG